MVRLAYIVCGHPTFVGSQRMLSFLSVNTASYRFIQQQIVLGLLHSVMNHLKLLVVLFFYRFVNIKRQHCIVTYLTLWNVFCGQQLPPAVCVDRYLDTLCLQSVVSFWISVSAVAHCVSKQVLISNLLSNSVHLHY